MCTSRLFHVTFTSLLQSVSVCCAAVRFVIVALLFIESLPYFTLLFKVIIYNLIPTIFSGIIYQTNLIARFKNRECSVLAFVSPLACHSRFHSRCYSRLLLFSFFSLRFHFSLAPFFTSSSNNSGKW